MLNTFLLSSPAIQPASSPPRDGSPSGGPLKEGAQAPRVLTSQEKLSLVTLSKFNMLENTVEDLKSRVYGSMPKNEEILHEVRSVNAKDTRNCAKRTPARFHGKV